MLRLLNEGWREGWRQQPKSHVSLTHCCVLAVPSSCFQASNVFCWVTVLQGIFPLWLIPPLTQRRNSKPASDFCALLPWGKHPGHGKHGFSSILYHLPLFPGSCLHPALSLGYGNHHGCLREPPVVPLTIPLINQPLPEDGCKRFLWGFSLAWTAVVAKGL